MLSIWTSLKFCRLVKELMPYEYLKEMVFNLYFNDLGEGFFLKNSFFMKNIYVMFYRKAAKCTAKCIDTGQPAQSHSCGKHCEKKRNCVEQAISPFLTMFSTLCGTY